MKIIVDDDAEVARWCTYFGCEPEALRTAVASTGGMPEAVRLNLEALGKNRLKPVTHADRLKLEQDKGFQKRALKRAKNVKSIEQAPDPR